MIAHEEEYKGFQIKIHYDEDSENPRDWDHLGTMVCWHRRHSLGDEHHYDSPADFKRRLAMQLDPTVEGRIDYWEDGRGWDQLWRHHRDDGCVEADRKVAKVIQDTLDKHCVMLKDGINHHLHAIKHITKKDIDRARELLISEVKEYDQYLTGDVYGYVVEDADGEHIDSCWGFYGLDYCIEEAKSAIDYHIKEAA